MDVKQSQGEPRLLISRQAILHNIRLIRRQLQPGTRVCAMIKADAYGHSAEVVADTLCNYQCDGLPCPAVEQLGVACLEEAMELPPAPVPILALRAVENVYLGRQRSLIEHAIRKGWILTLGSGAAADDVARIALATGRRAAVHVMIDTGMTRCGCTLDRLSDLLSRISSHTSLRIVSLGTHFATADVQDHAYVAEQFRRFREATDEFVARPGAGRILRSAANSGGIFFFPHTQLGMVRPGISLYGIDPACRPATDRPLRPVARWTAPLVSILEAKAGASVGYGQTWTAPRDTRIGLVPIGYADGYFRAWGNRASMIVQGVSVPVVGRVSMDLVTIDLHAAPQCQIGDEVTVMDDDPLSPASAYALAESAGTIPYEVFTRIGQRVKRVAVDSAPSPRHAQKITT